MQMPPEEKTHRVQTYTVIVHRSSRSQVPCFQFFMPTNNSAPATLYPKSRINVRPS
jgi:hypothetical protein